jgi:hypothetical protein
MATYFMYDDTTDCTINVDLINLDFRYIYQDILDELDDSINSVNFVLNKYSWDDKRPYEPNTHQGIIDDARSSKASLLLNKRKLTKLIKRLDT